MNSRFSLCTVTVMSQFHIGAKTISHTCPNGQQKFLIFLLICYPMFNLFMLPKAILLPGVRTRTTWKSALVPKCIHSSLRAAIVLSIEAIKNETEQAEVEVVVQRSADNGLQNPGQRSRGSRCILIAAHVTIFTSPLCGLKPRV